MVEGPPPVNTAGAEVEAWRFNPRLVDRCGQGLVPADVSRNVIELFLIEGEEVDHSRRESSAVQGPQKVVRPRRVAARSSAND